VEEDSNPFEGQSAVDNPDLLTALRADKGTVPGQSLYHTEFTI